MFYNIGFLLYDMNDGVYLNPEKIAYIVYNIWVYETIQKFGGLIMSGKINNQMDVSKIADLLSSSSAFYDSEIISGIVNAMIWENKDSVSLIKHVSPNEIDQVFRQLKICGIPLPK